MEALSATKKERAQEVFALIPERFREEFGIRMETSDYKGYITYSLILDKCSLTFGNAYTLSVSVMEYNVTIRNKDGVYLNLYIFGTGSIHYNIMAL